MIYFDLKHAKDNAFDEYFKSINTRILSWWLKRKYLQHQEKPNLSSFEDSAITAINRWYKFSKFMRYALLVITFGSLKSWSGSDDFLDTNKQANQLIQNLEKQSAVVIVGIIAYEFTLVIPELKAAYRVVISDKMNKMKISDDPIRNYKFALLKQAFSEQFPGSEENGWKDRVFGASYKRILKARNAKVTADFRFATPLTDESQERIVDYHVDDGLAGAMSTSFTTTNKRALANNKQPGEAPVSGHIMDSGFAAFSEDYNRMFVSIADGLGGHTGDDAENTRISRASYFASKHAVRLMSTYDNPDELFAAIPEIVKTINKEVERKIDYGNESTSLTCATAFLNGDHLRVIGFSIGESMMFSWDPKLQTVTDLLPAVQKVSDMMGGGPAGIPGKFDPESEVQTIDKKIPVTSVLIPLTDGISDAFSKITEENVIDLHSFFHSFFFHSFFKVENPDKIKILNQLSTMFPVDQASITSLPSPKK